METILQCPNPDCGGTDLEYSEPDGATICMNCHTIVEENAIVSSVEFNENAAGGSSTVVGQFVGAEMTKAYSSSGRGRRRFYNRDSRDTTLNNGRRAIQQVVSQLRLRQAFVDRAGRLFRTAVEKNFVQGRKTMCVVAVCLYMVCREDNSPHMLIDFSDAVQINVYVLGHAFLKFKQLTGMALAVIDPSIYIHRFAARLELGTEQEQTQISNMALRLVASMQRDWIQAGRRPSGICGAALYLAALFHDKPRSFKDVAKVVRVSPETIKKRVDEFSQTATSNVLTAEQLIALTPQDFESARGPPVLAGLDVADPPCFTRAPRRAAGSGKRGRGGSRSRSRQTGGGGAEEVGEDDGDEAMDEGLYKDLMDELLDQEEVRAAKARQEENAAHVDNVQNLQPSQPVAQDTGEPTAEGVDDHGFAPLRPEDDDTEQYIRSADEVEKLSRVWHEVHRGYLEKQERKKAEAAAAQKRAEEGKSFRPPPRKRTKAATAGQAIDEQLARKKVSKKINYEAVQMLGGPPESEELPAEIQELLSAAATLQQPQGIIEEVVVEDVGANRGGRVGAKRVRFDGDVQQQQQQQEDEEEDEEEEEEEEEEAVGDTGGAAAAARSAAAAVAGSEEPEAQLEVVEEDHMHDQGDEYVGEGDEGYGDEEDYGGEEWG